MTLAVPLTEDYHVHSTFSDGASTVAQNIAMAESRGLRRLCLSDHVRQDTTWVPDYLAVVQAARETSSTELLTGVEAKILDQTGRLDLPADMTGIDLVLIADHQFPGEDGPVLPDQMRVQIEQGTIDAQEAIDALIDATATALAGLSGPRPLIAHLFSVLPKMGLTESAVSDVNLDLIASRASDTGALLEINEKWCCPSARTVSAFASAGVTVVAGSDSHDCQDIGVFPTVRQTIDAVAAGSSA